MNDSDIDKIAARVADMVLERVEKKIGPETLKNILRIVQIGSAIVAGYLVHRFGYVSI